MENKSSVAIEIKGIVRNQTKIGVQDGTCNDLVNITFKDGSWRVSSDGKMVYKLANNYSQLYVHTNIYHHLLGVKDNKLWWFATIENDLETVTNLETPIDICEVHGDVTIVQNGHLLTIISNGVFNNINYSIFINSNSEYKKLNVNANGEQTDRGLYPFGRVHLNLDCDYKEGRVFKDTDTNAGFIKLDDIDINYQDSGALVPKEDEETTRTAALVWHNSMLAAFKKAKDANSFTRPFIAIVAIRLYDGSYLYASNPILLNPREKYNSYKTLYVDNKDIKEGEFKELLYQHQGVRFIGDAREYEIADKVYYKDVEGVQLEIKAERVPNYYSGAISISNIHPMGGNILYDKETHLESIVIGADLLMTLGDLSVITDNKDVFKGISIFITKEVDIYDMSAEGYKKGGVACFGAYKNVTGISESRTIGNVMYRPSLRSDREIANDLINSPFYLLREYNVNELLSMMNTTTLVDLSDVKYNGILSTIEQQKSLTVESFGRSEFIPKTAYQYNQKLHIGNYQSKQFHGYPIDCFHLSNHNLNIESNSFAVGGVLPKVKEGEDYQYGRQKFYFAENSFSNHDEEYIDKYIISARSNGLCYASISTTIETQQGNQKVARYILPYNCNSVNSEGSILDEQPFQNGDVANFIEDMSPILSFPDARATKMDVEITYLRVNNIVKRYKSFNLTPHPYLNIAYYLKDNLQPIDIGLEFSFKSTPLEEVDGEIVVSDPLSYTPPPIEENNIEEYPNGMKVSAINNPFIFPYENTYQIGSAEIVALMSNAVAVGTGQTGAAPLYVFCKDGVYALMVDSTGEMTYTNARIIARDVCNNAKSVTPIDSGVVFTTDRGLMTIAGSEVVEIGSAAEGDIFEISDTTDKAKKIMFNAFTMSQLAEFPQSLVDNTDFLTYLNGAIVNYNHNERELMVSNPDKDYTYVMDRNGNWSRRAFTAKEYVNNYPTSYRIDNAGNFYKVDADDNDTNRVYLLSNVIKLGTIAFKQAYRLVVRGYFETNSAAYGKVNGIPVKVVGSFIDRMKDGGGLQMAYITQYGQQMWVDVNNDNYVLNGQIKILDLVTNEDITYSVVSVNSGQYFRVVKSYEKIGCYVFGSYDGRQWALLGGKEKGGKFTDIGCKISHTDIRFLRICLAGKLTKDTRIDYIEVSADGSALNSKLR